MQVDLNFPSRQIIEEAARVIRQGGIVFHPSDTIYGLGCDPYNEEALKRIFEIKGRRAGKGLLILVPQLRWIEPLVDHLPRCFPELASRLWPGPVTLLLPARRGLSRLITGDGEKVGIRCPDSSFLQAWLRAIPGPIISTSANRSGHPYSGRIAELRRQFEGVVDLFLEAGDVSKELPSSVLDLTLDPPMLTRRGQFAEEVEKSLGNLVKQ